MKKGFTIVEVSILFVIFLIVAFLVAPLSLNDTLQAKNTSKWRYVQQEFSNILQTIKMEGEDSALSFLAVLESVFQDDIKDSISPYRITYMNGAYPPSMYRFKDFQTTYSNAVISIKTLEHSKDNVVALLMYDVNGKVGPNVWGKDVFGFNIYDNKFEPFGKHKPLNEQKKDCSGSGTGLYCSNYYLLGGSFD